MVDVTLIFPSVRAMREFMDVIQAANTEINLRTLTLICDCSEADIKLARETFGARVVESKPKEN
ncbi:MAG TPA: hypothetical protein VMY77_05205 [Chitinophagaceae bacterium]|nr:hypothetical protein [Chitinophagaceae bacterium]